MAIAIHVDDFLLVTPYEKDAIEFNKLFRTTFKATGVVDANWYLGLQLKKIGNTLSYGATRKIQELAQSLGLDTTRRVKTPMPKENNELADLELFLDIPRFQSVVGSLLYIQHQARPDISFPTNIAARAMSKPTWQDWKLALRIVCYLATTPDLTLRYNISKADHPEIKLCTYSDSDWAGKYQPGCRSTSGYLCQLENVGDRKSVV